MDVPITLKTKLDQYIHYPLIKVKSQTLDWLIMKFEFLTMPRLVMQEVLKGQHVPYTMGLVRLS